MKTFVDKCDHPCCVFDVTESGYEDVGKISKCELCGRRIKWEEKTGFTSDGDEVDYLYGVTINETTNNS